MANLTPDITLRPGSLPDYAVEVSVDTSRSLASLSPRFLSFALDTSQLVGGKWWNPNAAQIEYSSGSLDAPQFDFNRPALDRLVSALAPAYLRLGGSEADKVFYDMDAPQDTRPVVPPGYHSVLTSEQWDAACRFTQRNGLGLMFTLNAGSATRGKDSAWDSRNAEALLAYTVRQGHEVDVWQLGNEVNVFFSVHGWRSQISAAQYAADLGVARRLVDRLAPEASLASQGSAFWPLLGELPLHPLGFMPRVLEKAGALVDQVVWHYYPQQSRRGPYATRRATPTRLLNPRNLDEAGRWSAAMQRWRDRYTPGKPLWMGETGNAQFGGEPGVSDRYIGGLWWLDQLGLLARYGHEVVVRQTLCGMDYGMLDDDLTPRPDYWNSLLWRRLMGQQVYAAQVQGPHATSVRAYAHAAASAPAPALAILLINLDRQRSAQITLPQFRERSFVFYHMSTPDILGKQVLLNGAPLRFDATSQYPLPELVGEWREASEMSRVVLNPLSYGFVIINRSDMVVFENY